MYKENPSIPFCKYCKKPMVFKNQGYTGEISFWEYECQNEECSTKPKLKLHHCEICGEENEIWKD